MNQRDLKKMLSDSLQLEEELYEYIEDCLREIYPDKEEFEIAKFRFHEGVNWREDMGCIQSLGSLINKRKREIEQENKVQD